MMNRLAWVLAAILAGTVMVGVGLLLPWLRAYGVARYRGNETGVGNPGALLQVWHQASGNDRDQAQSLG
jgi:hypothetical protein